MYVYCCFCETVDETVAAHVAGVGFAVNGFLNQVFV